MSAAIQSIVSPAVPRRRQISVSWQVQTERLVSPYKLEVLGITFEMKQYNAKAALIEKLAATKSKSNLPKF